MEEMLARQGKEEKALDQEAKDAIHELEVIQASAGPLDRPVVAGLSLPCNFIP